MKRFIQGEDRTQGILLPELLDDYVADTNPLRGVVVGISSRLTPSICLHDFLKIQYLILI